MHSAASPEAYQQGQTRPQRAGLGMPIRPLRALRAFQRLMANKEDTAQVFEIMSALAGRSTPRGYWRLTRTAPDLAFEQAELARLFSDPRWLAGFAPGTVGAAYRDFMQSENLSAEGLADEQRRIEPGIDEGTVFAWYARRMRDIHDVWHVLTGYGRDALGEACVVSFSYAQTGSTGFAFIGLGAADRIARNTPGVPARRAVLEAYRNGRRAAWLPGERYEALFAEPLAAARARLNIRAPGVYQSVSEDVRGAIRLV